MLNRLREIDDAYSTRINQMYNRIGNPGLATVGAMIGGGHPSLRKGDGSPIKNKYARAAYEYGMPAVAAVSKYAIPVTAAGLALHGLTVAFGGQGDQQESGQLPMR